MTDALTITLQTHFGFSTFRPGQEEAIRSILAGRDTLIVMPTGAGKSLIYQLPALLRPGLTLVISPLVALMKDQVDSLTRRGIPALSLSSTLSTAEQARRLREIIAGAYRLLYVAPERLHSRSFQEAMRRVPVGLLAVDEAHCVSLWGHEFRPDYRQIAGFRTGIGNPVVVALTATATPRVQEDILRGLGLPSARQICLGFDRPNLTFEVKRADGWPTKLRALAELLVAQEGEATIVYAGSRAEAELIGEFIRTEPGIPARHYHAGLEASERSAIQDAFLAGNLGVVVATVAFGMGIDRPDVRLIVHFTVPGTVEAYYQEAGRAGRDGKAACAVLLYDPHDAAYHEALLGADLPSLFQIQTVYETLRARGQEVSIQAETLSRTLGLRGPQLRAALAQLERAGMLRRLGDEWPWMRFRLSPWEDAAAQAVAAEGAEHRRWRHEQRAQMIAYAEATICRRRALLDYFGDDSPSHAAACCDLCLQPSRPVSVLPVQATESLTSVESVALAVLDALQRHRTAMGPAEWVETLAEQPAVEAASREGRQRTSTRWHALARVSRAEIEYLIERLIQQEYLALMGGKRPALLLTPSGEAALHGQPPLLLHLPLRAERAAGGSVELTAALLARGFAPAQVAFLRGLSEGAVGRHIAQLAEAGRWPSAAGAPRAAEATAAGATVGTEANGQPADAHAPDHPDGDPPAWEQYTEAQKTDAIAAFLARPHPRRLVGPWDAGWALDLHSRFAGGDRSLTGTGALADQLKYAGDPSALLPLAEQALSFCAAHPELLEVDALVPVPSSEARELEPVSAWAETLGSLTGRPVWPLLVKARHTQPQKELHSRAQKRDNTRGAFALHGDALGKRLLVLDDLYDSGATLAEVTRVLRRAGAARVCVLTLTRTIHTDD